MMELNPKKKPEARADLRPHCKTCPCAPPYLSVDAVSFAKDRTCVAPNNPSTQQLARHTGDAIHGSLDPAQVQIMICMSLAMRNQGSHRANRAEALLSHGGGLCRCCQHLGRVLHVELAEDAEGHQ